MSLWRSILDMVLLTPDRASLRVYGRDTLGTEDRLLPQYDRDEAVLRCRDLRRNNPIVSGAALCLSDNIVGGEIRIQCRTSDRAWNETAERWLRDWASSCADGGRLDLTEVCNLAVWERLAAGEIFLALRPDGGISVVESEQVRPPEGDPNGLAYRAREDGSIESWCLWDRDRNGGFSAGCVQRWVPLLHATGRIRPAQVRGEPDLAPIANTIQDVGEINTANLKKSKLGAMAAWVLRGRRGAGLPRKVFGSAASGGTLSLTQFRNGQIYELEDGQDLQQFVANQPGSEYGPFVELNLRLVGMALRVPYEFLVCYFSGGNFSSSRAALMQAYKTFATWQRWLWKSIVRPVAQWRLAMAIRDRELPPAPVDPSTGVSEFGRVEWQRPAVEWIDPQAAINAEIQELRMGATTMARICAERGMDAEENLRDNAAYLRLVADVAREYRVAPSALFDASIPGQTPQAPQTPAPPPAPADEEPAT